MSYHQVRDIIERVESFRGRLEEIYRSRAALSGDERLRMLLQRQRAREDLIAEQLEDLDEHAARGVLETWIQNVPETALEPPRIDDSMSSDDVVGRILEKDGQVLELFRRLSESRLAPRVQELFASLASLEQAKNEELAAASPAPQ